MQENTRVLQALTANFAVFQLLRESVSPLLDVRTDYNFSRVCSNFAQGDVAKDPLRPLLIVTPPKRGNRNSYVSLLQTATGARPGSLKFTIAPDDIPTVPKGSLQAAQSLDDLVSKLLSANQAGGTQAFGLPLSAGSHAYLGIQMVVGDSQTKLFVAIASKGKAVYLPPLWKLLQLDENSACLIDRTTGAEALVLHTFESTLSFETELTAT